MYEIFVNNHKSSYCFYDDEINAQKHPQIELGSTIFIPDLGVNYLAVSPQKWQLVGDLVGIDLRTALTHLNGDVNNAKITANINNITYGFNKDYENIINNYPKTPVDIEQDSAVSIYYIPNGDNYDVYVLSNGEIYAPKDSSSLYEGMSALKSINFSNYNVSRVSNMSKMFKNCSLLEFLDTSNWNTANVTDMSQIFHKCGLLQHILGIEHWNTGSVTTMLQMFRECGISGDLDLTAWNVSNVANMEDLFYKCGNITSLNLANWNTSSCTNMGWMFGCASQLESINVSGWDTSNVTLMPSTFYECLALKTLDLTDWDTSKVTDTKCMFIRCRSLQEIVGSGNLNFCNVVNMESMCEGLDVMTTLDVTNWGCDNVTNMKQMFGWALNMQEIIGIENWNVANVTTMRTMFYRSPAFETLDLSNWNTESLQNTLRMFRDCTKLNTIYVGNNWNMSNVSTSTEMFYNCQSLSGEQGTTVEAMKSYDATYAKIDGGLENPGYLSRKDFVNL